MFPFRRPPLPPRDFPLVLRQAWRTDISPRIGRLRALERLKGPRTERPPSIIERARRGRIVALNARATSAGMFEVMAAE